MQNCPEKLSNSLELTGKALLSKWCSQTMHWRLILRGNLEMEMSLSELTGTAVEVEALKAALGQENGFVFIAGENEKGKTLDFLPSSSGW